MKAKNPTSLIDSTKLVEWLNANYIFPNLIPEIEDIFSSNPLNPSTPIEDYLRWTQLINSELQRVTSDFHFRCHLLKRPDDSQSYLKLWDRDFFPDESFLKHYDSSLERKNYGVSERRLLSPATFYLKLDLFPLLTNKCQNFYNKILSAQDNKAPPLRNFILDLRHNGGGFPHSVIYLSSFFFAKSAATVHLNTIFWHPNRSIQPWFTDRDHGGPDLSLPRLFILTSKETFSAAEEFCYNLQQQKRATLIGERTKGGAHPTVLFPLHPLIKLGIPVGVSINPVTRTNWEGVGVRPDVVAASHEVLQNLSHYIDDL